MKRTLTPLGPVLVLALALLGAAAAPSALRQEHEKEYDTELGRNMEHIEDTVRAMRKQLKDPATYANALESLVEIERTTLACKGLAPELAGKLPETERAAMVTAYRKTMVEFLGHQLELESAILDADAERIKAAFERFKAMEDSSHEKFAPDEH